MSFKTMLVMGLLLVAGMAHAASDQNASVGYQVPIKDSKQISATGLTSSDTPYNESRCIGGELEFTNACKTTSGRNVDQIMLYKVQYFNAGTSTVDATLLLFSESFTSPGDNAAWAMGDGEFSEKYITRIDLAQTAQVESGGDTYAEALEVNINCPCTADRNIYGQLVKNKVGPITTGGDTRSASADAVVRLWTHQLEK